MILTKTLKNDFNYRGLGGKKITLEKELTREEVKKAENWACYNFLDRRPDTGTWYTKRLFYGHAEDNLGYVVCEDEIEGEIPKFESVSGI